MKLPYTDIAAELYGPPRGTVPRGVRVHTASAAGVRLTRVEIQREGLRRPKGCYITLDMPHFASIDQRDETFVHAIAGQLRSLVPREGKVLVAGIGNRSVRADALGPTTADQIFVAQQKSAAGIPLRPVAALAPGAEGATGLVTSEVLRGIAAVYKPAALVCVDSLCTSLPPRLGCSVQLSSAGLVPRGAPALNEGTVGVPVIAVGVPTVMELRSGDGAPVLMTPKEIDAIVAHGAVLLALAINKALQPALSVGELSFLTS